MTKRSIALNFRQRTPIDLYAFAGKVQEGFVDNVATYPSPVISTADQKIANDALMLAIVEAGHKGGRGSTLSILLRDTAVDLVQENLKKLAAYCMSVTPNDVLSWFNVGFPAKHLRERASVPQAPTGLTQVFRNSIPPFGIKLSWRKPLDVPRRRTVLYKVLRSNDAALENAIEVTIVSKRSYTDFVDKKGVIYYYWVVPFNSHGVGNPGSCIPAYAALLA